MPIILQDVCGVIVTYNRPQLLGECLAAIIASETVPVKIIVVDNGNPDSQQQTKHIVNDAIVKLSGLSIQHYCLNKNIGGAGGFATGMGLVQESKSYRYVWIMDDDVEPLPDTLRHLHDRIDDDTIVVPYRLYKDGSSAEYSGIKYNFSNPLAIRPKRETVCNKFPNPDEIDEIDLEGFAFEGPLIPLAIVNHIGLPKAEFFIFGDDTDFALRAKAQGHRSVMLGKAKLYRKIRKPSLLTTLNSWKGDYIIRNNHILDRLHGENWAVKNIRPLINAFIYALLLILGRNWPAFAKNIKSFNEAKVISKKIS